MTEPDHLVAIIGAGPGGICASVLLQRKGINDFVVIDQAADFGGSWRDNHYPGLGVDVPGFTYQYSFARNPEWKRLFPMGRQVWEYHREVAREHDLYSHARWNTRVVKEEWDDAAGFWRLHVDDGSQITARFVISAIGAYIKAKEDPGIPGYRDFAGKILRPNDWDHDYDLSGKRVAVIGTGASSVQITPSIAPEVAALEVFQRTPVWALPKPDFPLPVPVRRAMATPVFGGVLSAIANLVVEAALRLVYQTPRPLFRAAAPRFDSVSRALYRLYLRSVVRDADVRKRLMPDYGPLGKRPTLSNAFLQAFNRDNVALVDEPIERIVAGGIETADGRLHEFDAIVLATGYHLFSDPESYTEGSVVGRDGFDLGVFYNEERLQAYQSVAVPKLPNRWMLVGPYSWIGTGWHELVEISSSHAVNVIDAVIARGADVAEVSQEAHEDYHAMIRRNDENIDYYFNTVNAGLRTYYVNSAGDMPYIRPTSLFEARKQSRHVELDAYQLRTLARPAVGEVPTLRRRMRAGAGK
ncbi:putative flavin-containing monooxygenase [Gordonia araii NBRC 100433]|uniref:Putative flavin-containing monooxygenase n=1 Tax=Gordonia araii NBRC 100433 TaxID=1073574 RepID=G7GY01_9ACTN|nr:NAD(P)/FAD-dependent oxidoreductase [Gordonia araii]NNG98087.1 NAD(P)/FAD-dependent oxidoreductase [Gordonia araii NBRC 100433]GAB08476.1 putative flavin-containing monooxygenase [Gordonia araii NBRC 100433]